MKFFWIVLIACLMLLVGALFAPLFIDDPGYVLVRFGGWAVETSVIAGLGLLFVVIGAVWLTAWVLRLPGRGARAVARHQERRSVETSLKALSEGRWDKAEKALAKTARRGKAPALGYLAAARAARGEDADKRRERYLALASAEAGDSFSVRLNRAEMLLERGQDGTALALLRQLRQQKPHHPQVLSLLADALAEQQLWHELYRLVPAMRQAGALTGLEAQARQRLAAQAMLAAESQAKGLEKTWRGLEKSWRRDPAVVRVYARRAHELGQGKAARPALVKALQENWHDELLWLLAHLPSAEPSADLKSMEKLLSEHPDDASLMHVLGVLAARARLWGKADHYLQAAAAKNAHPETALWQARVAEAADDEVAALTFYRKAAAMRLERKADVVSSNPASESALVRATRSP